MMRALQVGPADTSMTEDPASLGTAKVKINRLVSLETGKNSRRDWLGPGLKSNTRP